MYPFTQFLKKHPQDQSDELKDLNAFMYSSKMRTKYTSLSDKKKLKYIKEAESIYDAFKVETLIITDDSIFYSPCI